MDTDKQQVVFHQLVNLIQSSVDLSPFTVRDEAKHYEVNTRKVTDIGNNKVTFFVAVMIHKGHVGFYYFPAYVDPNIRERLSPELAKMLKGKTCFHCKKELSEDLEAQIAQLLRSGVEMYQQNGWL